MSAGPETRVVYAGGKLGLDNGASGVGKLTSLQPVVYFDGEVSERNLVTKYLAAVRHFVIVHLRTK